MKKTILLLLFLTTCLINTYAQLVFVDSANRTVIPAVSVYTDAGNLIAISDYAGKVSSKLIGNSNLFFQHISYQNKSLLKTQTPKDTVYLTPLTISLAPVEVHGSAQPSDYIVVTGYYRDHQLFEGKHKYFSDGMVSYYIPLKRKTRKIQHKILGSRVFSNDTVVRRFKKYMGIFEEPPAIPPYIGKLTLADVKKSKKWTLDHQKPEEWIIYNKTHSSVGNIKLSTHPNTLQVYVDYVRPMAVQNRKIFGLQIGITQRAHIETYITHQIENADYQNLQSMYVNNVATVKIRKQPTPAQFEMIAEFYVTKRNFISEKQYQQIEKELEYHNFSPLKSVIQQPFWESLSEYHIPPLAPSIEKSLYKDLKLL